MKGSSRTSAWPRPWSSPEFQTLSPMPEPPPTLLAGVGVALVPPATEDVVWLRLLLPPLEDASWAILMLIMIEAANNSC